MNYGIDFKSGEQTLELAQDDHSYELVRDYLAQLMERRLLVKIDINNLGYGHQMMFLFNVPKSQPEYSEYRVQGSNHVHRHIIGYNYVGGLPVAVTREGKMASTALDPYGRMVNPQAGNRPEKTPVTYHNIKMGVPTFEDLWNRRIRGTVQASGLIYVDDFINFQEYSGDSYTGRSLLVGVIGVSHENVPTGLCVVSFVQMANNIDSNSRF